jgi:beta-galactosidase
MQMESTPSAANWNPINKLKRPGVHQTEMLQAVAHGADTIQYFQWRKNRGNAEKFHGAVVDHCGHENTRVFREVAAIGGLLQKLDLVIGTSRTAEVAVMYDWENGWIIDDIKGPRNEKKNYLETCVAHYREFWSRGVPVDIVGEESDFSKYRLLIAPMLYMLRPGVAGRIIDFVNKGGVFVTTYLSGIADESDLCFLGGWPGPLRKLLGIWAEEIDALYDDESVSIVPVKRNAAGLSGIYKARLFCDLIHAEGARVLAKYGSEFYAGRPAVTCNAYGQGEAWYIASRNDERFHADFLGNLISRLKLRRIIAANLPGGVTAQMRSDGTREFIFLLNFTRKPHEIGIGDRACTNMQTGKKAGPIVKLGGYGSAVLMREARKE